MPKFEIKNRWDGKIIYQAEAENFSALIQAAAKAKVDLQYSNLSDSNLSGSDLSGSDLSGSDLSGSDLSGSDLRDSDLQYSNLRGSNLSGSNLQYSDLQYSNLRDSDLRGSNLQYSNLRGSNLSGSNLSDSNLQCSNLQYSDLQYSNLRDSDLRDSDLSGSKNIPDSINAETMIVPESGAFEGWKKCQNNILVHVLIPADAKRSNATGRKCRASHAQVIEVIGSYQGLSTHDNGKTAYRVGETVKCDVWNEDRWVECGGGIHFFITRLEAELY